MLSTYEILKRPISQKKEFWTKFSRGSRGTCHEILTAQLIILEKSEVVLLFKWNITEKNGIQKPDDRSFDMMCMNSLQ